MRRSPKLFRAALSPAKLELQIQVVLGSDKLDRRTPNEIDVSKFNAEAYKNTVAGSVVQPAPYSSVRLKCVVVAVGHDDCTAGLVILLASSAACCTDRPRVPSAPP